MEECMGSSGNPKDTGCAPWTFGLYFNSVPSAVIVTTAGDLMKTLWATFESLQVQGWVCSSPLSITLLSLEDECWSWLFLFAACLCFFSLSISPLTTVAPPKWTVSFQNMKQLSPYPEDSPSPQHTHHCSLCPPARLVRPGCCTSPPSAFPPGNI